jgi:hypothetical protein
MENSKQIASVYDDWEKTLTPEQKKWCQEAQRRIVFNFRNIGDLSAKELIVVILLYCDPKQSGDNYPKRPETQ